MNQKQTEVTALYALNMALEAKELAEKPVRRGQGGLMASVTSDHGALTGLTDDDHPQYAQNRNPLWYDKLRLNEFLLNPLWTAQQASDNSGWNDWLWTNCFPITRKMKLDKLGIYVNDGTNDKMRLGIYNSNAACEPTTLIAQCEFTIASGGGAINSGDIDVTLDKGLYHIAMLVKDSNQKIPSFYSVASPCGKYSNSLAPRTGWGATYSYASMPADFPAIEGDQYQCQPLFIRINQLW